MLRCRLGSKPQKAEFRQAFQTTFNELILWPVEVEEETGNLSSRLLP
jgi:hypothetical protein